MALPLGVCPILTESERLDLPSGAGQRIACVIFETGIVGFDEDGERPAGGYEIRLVHVALDRTQRIENGAVNLVPVRLAFDIGEGAQRKIDAFAGRALA